MTGKISDEKYDNLILDFNTLQKAGENIARDCLSKGSGAFDTATCQAIRDGASELIYSRLWGWTEHATEFGVLLGLIISIAVVTSLFRHHIAMALSDKSPRVISYIALILTSTASAVFIADCFQYRLKIDLFEIGAGAGLGVTSILLWMNIRKEE